MSVRGKTILVTGSTDGVGRWVAERLGADGARVIVHGRNRARGDEVAERSRRAEAARSSSRPTSPRSRKSANSQKPCATKPTGLDVLVNNAGIGTAGNGRQVSADGFELRFSVNYLAGFLLTRLLLPLIEARAPSRIVNVASAGQQPIDFDDVMLTRGYDGWRAYRQSKLAQILFTFDLADELEGRNVTANALHPATFMDTTMVRRSGMQPVEQSGGRRRGDHAAHRLARARR